MNSKLTHINNFLNDHNLGRRGQIQENTDCRNGVLQQGQRDCLSTSLSLNCSSQNRHQDEMQTPQHGIDDLSRQSLILHLQPCLLWPPQHFHPLATRGTLVMCSLNITSGLSSPGLCGCSCLCLQRFLLLTTSALLYGLLCFFQVS